MTGEFASNGIGYYAMRLALTRTMAEEKQVKQELAKAGLRFAATETGGKSSEDFQRKLTKSVLGAPMNENVIQKTPPEIHAVIHAMQEAEKGILMDGVMDSNLAVKIAIVRNAHWIAVALFGESAMHLLTGHERCGLGVMHI